MWMFIGLLVTFITGIYTSTNVDALEVIFNKSGYWILLIVELGLAIFLSARIHKMSPTTARICYLLYTFFTGLTFSSIFIVYKIESIMLVFLVTAILFLIFAIIGKTTKVDLTKISTILLMALLGVIICTIINIFLQNSTFDMILSGISVLIFLGFIAYDIIISNKS